MTGLRLVGPGVPRGRRQPIRRRVTRPTGCGTRAATHRPGRAGSRERRPRWTQEVPYAPWAWPSRCTNALPARRGRPAARDGNGESGVLITVSPCRSRRASIARPPACRTPAVRTRCIVITIAEPAVEKLRPDEPDVSFEGCRIDLLQLLGNAGEHRKILSSPPSGRVLLGPARFAEEFGIGHTTGRSNAAKPQRGNAGQPLKAVSASAAHTNPSSSCTSIPAVRTPATDAMTLRPTYQPALIQRSLEEGEVATESRGTHSTLRFLPPTILSTPSIHRRRCRVESNPARRHELACTPWHLMCSHVARPS